MDDGRYLWGRRVDIGGSQRGLYSLMNAFFRMKSVHKSAFKARKRWKRQNTFTGQEKGTSNREIKDGREKL